MNKKNENKVLDDISKKIEVSITIGVFLIILMQVFTEDISKSREIFIVFSAFIGVQVINYAIVCSLKYCKQEIGKCTGNFINFLLITYFFFVGIAIISTLFILNKISIPNILNGIFAYIFVIPISIFILLFFILISCLCKKIYNFSKKNKQKQTTKPSQPLPS